MNLELENRDELVKRLKDDQIALETVIGCVGKAVGTQLRSFLNVYDKLNIIEDVLKGKKVKTKIEELNIAYAVAVSLSLKAENQKQGGFVMEFVEQCLPGMDFMVLAAKILYSKGIRIVKHIAKIDVLNIV